MVGSLGLSEHKHKSAPAQVTQVNRAKFKLRLYIGLFERATPALCPPLGAPAGPAAPVVPVAPVASDPAAVAAARASAKAAKAVSKAAEASAKVVKAAAKSAAAVAAAASAEAAKRPVGAVANAPSTDVNCRDNTGTPVLVPLVSIQTAVRLAQAGPVLSDKAQKFPHTFRNKEHVNTAAACVGKGLEEHAVGVDMSKFVNIPSVISTPAFNQFRVVITTPDATGATTFCGVMTHGTVIGGNFETDLCTPV